MTCHAKLADGGTTEGRRCARGFTLLELMIVLAILATLMAVAWPSLRRPLNRSQTLEAARQLAEDVARTRLLAIERGETMTLRFEPGGSRYRIEPAERASGDAQQDGDGIESSRLDPELDAQDDSQPDAEPTISENVDEPLPEMVPIEQELPNEVVFTDPFVAEDAEDEMGQLGEPPLEDLPVEDEQLAGESDQQLGEDSALGNDQPSVNWSTPVLFYPTGRADSVLFRLKGTNDYWVTVTLRGLTGAVKIGTLKHRIRTADQREQAEMEQANQDQWGDQSIESGPDPTTGGAR